MRSSAHEAAMTPTIAPTAARPNAMATRVPAWRGVADLPA